MATVLSGSVPSVVTRCLRASYPAATSSFRHKSTPATVVGGNEAQTTTGGPGGSSQDKDVLDLTFSDHQKAFRSKTNYELMRALFIFKLCGIKPLVEHNMKVSESLQN